MSAQGALFVPTHVGECLAADLEARLRCRATDPPTSRAAAKTAVRTLPSGVALALAIVQGYQRPATTWELADWAKASRIPGTETLDVTELHYLLARRLPDAERSGLVTCDRVRDARGETISAAEKLCPIRQKQLIAWRLP